MLLSRDQLRRHREVGPFFGQFLIFLSGMLGGHAPVAIAGSITK
jgi:hypothetical protein